MRVRIVAVDEIERLVEHAFEAFDVLPAKLAAKIAVHRLQLLGFVVDGFELVDTVGQRLAVGFELFQLADVGLDAADGVLEFVALFSERGEFLVDIFEIAFGFLFSLAGGFDGCFVELVGEFVAPLALVGQPLAAVGVALGQRLAAFGEALDLAGELVDPPAEPLELVEPFDCVGDLFAPLALRLDLLAGVDGLFAFLFGCLTAVDSLAAFRFGRLAVRCSRLALFGGCLSVGFDPFGQSFAVGFEVVEC